jgi:hypothetical protein
MIVLVIILICMYGTLGWVIYMGIDELFISGPVNKAAAAHAKELELAAELAAALAEQAAVDAVRTAQIKGVQVLADLLEEIKHLRAAMDIIAGGE